MPKEIRDENEQRTVLDLREFSWQYRHTNGSVLGARKSLQVSSSACSRLDKKRETKFMYNYFEHV